MAEPEDLNNLSRLPLDDQFLILLHKKLLNKKGATKRRAKKYYLDKYIKTGVIPGPLLLAGRGIMEGRKCSGRPQVLCEHVKKRFVVMAKASCDPYDSRFIFITRKARTIKNYHLWLEEEFNRKISLGALRRYAKENYLGKYLDKPDFEDQIDTDNYFDTEPVFDLIQVDGCTLQYLKIKNEKGAWQSPSVIEFYDTGSRYMFVLEFYFSENSKNSVELFIRFLLDRPFPAKTIRLRPDQAGGFLNLKRPISDLNLKFSTPGGFQIKPDFARPGKPKDKTHLESSHRSLHNFESRIIKNLKTESLKSSPDIRSKGVERSKLR